MVTAGAFADLVQAPCTGAGRWKALFPTHNDRSPSLSIRQGDDGRVFVLCRAGCAPDSILVALRLVSRDLYAGAPPPMAKAGAALLAKTVWPWWGRRQIGIVQVVAEISNLRTTADVYDPLMDWLEIEPLKLKELAPRSPIVHAKVDSIIHLSRAEALAGCSDLRKFKDALQRAFPELRGM